MSITATLIAQILTFGLLVWFVKATLWGPMTRMLEDRKSRIAEGLAAAERGRREHELAEQRAEERLRDAKTQAAEIIAQAQKRSAEIIDEAKSAATVESDRIKTAAEAELGQEIARAKQQLRNQVVSLAIEGASRVLGREVDEKVHEQALNDLVNQI